MTARIGFHLVTMASLVMVGCLVREPVDPAFTEFEVPSLPLVSWMGLGSTNFTIWIADGPAYVSDGPVLVFKPSPPPDDSDKNTTTLLYFDGTTGAFKGLEREIRYEDHVLVQFESWTSCDARPLYEKARAFPFYPMVELAGKTVRSGQSLMPPDPLQPVVSRNREKTRLAVEWAEHEEGGDSAIVNRTLALDFDNEAIPRAATLFTEREATVVWKRGPLPLLHDGTPRFRAGSADTLGETIAAEDFLAEENLPGSRIGRALAAGLDFIRSGSAFKAYSGRAADAGWTYFLVETGDSASSLPAPTWIVQAQFSDPAGQGFSAHVEVEEAATVFVPNPHTTRAQEVALPPLDKETASELVVPLRRIMTQPGRISESEADHLEGRLGTAGHSHWPYGSHQLSVADFEDSKNPGNEPAELVCIKDNKLSQRAIGLRGMSIVGEAEPQPQTGREARN